MLLGAVAVGVADRAATDCPPKRHFDCQRCVPVVNRDHVVQRNPVPAGHQLPRDQAQSLDREIVFVVAKKHIHRYDERTGVLAPKDLSQSVQRDRFGAHIVRISIGKGANASSTSQRW